MLDDISLIDEHSSRIQKKSDLIGDSYFDNVMFSKLKVYFIDLQLFYLAILGGTYFAVASTSFQYIPGPYVSAVHRQVLKLILKYFLLVCNPMS